MRNRINLSRGNYKKPYIRQPVTSAALPELRNEGGGETKLSTAGQGRGAGVAGRTEPGDEGTREMAAPASGEEDGRSDRARVGKRFPVHFDSRTACNDNASVASSARLSISGIPEP